MTKKLVLVESIETVNGKSKQQYISLTDEEINTQLKNIFDVACKKSKLEPTNLLDKKLSHIIKFKLDEKVLFKGYAKRVALIIEKGSIRVNEIPTPVITVKDLT